MQIIGPTRYGKGVAMGCIVDQAIKYGDAVVYIDPKRDTFIPQIMYQSAQENHRPFIYLTLHDDGMGYYAPFEGGSERDAFSRLLFAFNLESTGDPGTDYYKSIEKQHLLSSFKEGRSLKSLLNNLADNKEVSRTNAELADWAEVRSLSPSRRNQAFKIAKALQDGAIVYVQGKLDDPVIKTATKVFIRELIQESKRLVKARTHHLTVIVDEVSFLVSKTLAEALATSLADNVNFVLAYQSINDLLNTDDKNTNPQYINQSINVNSQLKLVYGGKDFDTAQWIAKQSGTIIKPVTRMEKTDVSLVGGESWEPHRFISNVEENLIPTNLILSLPPGVACFVQPNALAKVAFTSFVPVNDTQALPNYLGQYETVQQKATKSSNNPTKKARVTKVDATNKKTPINQEKPNPPAIKKAVTNVFEAKKKTPYKPSTNG